MSKRSVHATGLRGMPLNRPTTARASSLHGGEEVEVPPKPREMPQRRSA